MSHSSRSRGIPSGRSGDGRSGESVDDQLLATRQQTKWKFGARARKEDWDEFSAGKRDNRALVITTAMAVVALLICTISIIIAFRWTDELAKQASKQAAASAASNANRPRTDPEEEAVMLKHYALAGTCIRHFLTTGNQLNRLSQLRQLDGVQKRLIEYEAEVLRLSSLNYKLADEVVRKPPFLMIPVLFDNGETREAWVEITDRGTARLDFDSFIGTSEVPLSKLDYPGSSEEVVLRGFARVLNPDTENPMLEITDAPKRNRALLAFDSIKEANPLLIRELSAPDAEVRTSIVARKSKDDRATWEVGRIIGLSWFTTPTGKKEAKSRR